MVLAVALLALMWRRKKISRVVAIGFLGLVVAVNVVDYNLLSEVAEKWSLGLDDLLREGLADVTRSALTAFIWIPYFATSKRVAATFTE